MYVIKNIKKQYDCYLTEDNTWAGLLKAKVFKTQQEAQEAVSEDGQVYSWNEILGQKA